MPVFCTCTTFRKDPDDQNFCQHCSGLSDEASPLTFQQLQTVTVTTVAVSILVTLVWLLSNGN